MNLYEGEPMLQNKITSSLFALKNQHQDTLHIFSNESNAISIKDPRVFNTEDQELIYAAGIGDLQRVFALLYCEEVDPNITNSSGITPLIQATLSTQENLSIVDLLIDRGANVNATTLDGLTSLMIASIKNYKNIVLSLLKAGADVHKKDMFGYTAAELAARLGHHNIKMVLNDNSKQRF